MNNYDNKYDKIIIISNNSIFNDNMFKEIKTKLNSNNIKIENYILDYRLNNEKFNFLIKEINILKKEEDSNNNDIVYDNCYLLSNNNKGILDKLMSNSELNLDF